jgi:cytochrome P450
MVEGEGRTRAMGLKARLEKLELGAIRRDSSRPSGVRYLDGAAYRESSEDRLPPGSLGLPVIGETRAFLADQAEFLRTRFEKHGSIFKTRIAGHVTVCFGGRDGFARFSDPECFTRIGGSPAHVALLFNRKSLPFMDGATHRRLKRLMLMGFERERLGKYLPSLEALFSRYIGNWSTYRRFAWVPELSSLSFGIIDSTFLGADPAIEKPELKRAYERATSGVVAFPLSPKYLAALAGRRELDEYVAKVIAARRRAPGPDLVSELLSVRDEHGSTLADDELGIELTHFFLAGAPLQSALAYHLLLLGQHPEVMERARAEIRRVTPEGPLTMDALDRLEYVRRVCLESRRHAAVVPQTFFATVKKSFEFNGYHVPEGYKAIGCIATALHDERSVPRENRYDPDRFSPERMDREGMRDGFVAHGGGPPDSHRCAGEGFTSFVMAALTARLLRDHTWKVPEQDLGPRHDKVSPTPRDGLKVVFEAAP